MPCSETCNAFYGTPILMPRVIPSAQRKKFLRLLKDGVSTRAAGIAAGIAPTSAYRIAALAPFGDGKQGTARSPDPAWTTDQPPPPASPYEFKKGYHDHTFRSFSAPLAFAGFDLKRVRAAIDMHRNGVFYESSLLSLALLSFGPVLAATLQRIAPMLALPRQVKAGTRGLSRLLGEEIEAQMAPREGLAPSPHFPSQLWGTTAFDLAYMGFTIFQHVDGEPDPETGVRPRYTRRWPTWATQYYRYRRTFVAMTTEGPIDVLNDGKFTLVADSDEPHFLGAIVALGEEALDGKFTQRARASYINRYGNPKWVGVMPEGVAVNSPEGQMLLESLQIIQGPDGTGVLPHGTDYDLKGLNTGQSTTFKDALDSNWQFIAAILLGSDGTMSKGGGVYTSPQFQGIRRDLIDRDLKAALRAANDGHVRPYCLGNYGATIAESPSFVMPVVDIPLPDPDADARIKSYGDRLKSFHEVVQEERTAGFVVSQERIDQLAAIYSIAAPTLGDFLISPEDASKVPTVNEARKAQGLPPLEGEKGDLLLGEVDKAMGEKQTTTGTPGASAEQFGKAIEVAKTVGLRPTTESSKETFKTLGIDVEAIPQAQTSVKLDLAPTDVAKVVRVDEARTSQGLPPIGDERGQLTIQELEQNATAPETAPDAVASTPPVEPSSPAP